MSCASRPKAASPTTTGITWDRIDREYGRLLALSRQPIIRARPASMRATSSTILTAKPTFNR